jgi:hypothetical protein
MDFNSINSLIESAKDNVDKVSSIINAMTLTAANLSFFDHLTTENKIIFMTYADKEKFHQVFIHHKGYVHIAEIPTDKIREWVSTLNVELLLRNSNYVIIIDFLITNSFLTFEQIFEDGYFSCVTIKEYVAITKKFLQNGLVNANSIIDKIYQVEINSSWSDRFIAETLDLFETCLYYVDDIEKILWPKFEKVRDFDLLRIIYKFLSNKIHLTNLQNKVINETN